MDTQYEMAVKNVRFVLRELLAKGWTVTAVDNGMGPVVVSDIDGAMAEIVDVDMADVFVMNVAGKRYWFQVIFGNDADEVISDYSSPEDTHSDYGRIMDDITDRLPY